MMTFRIIKQVSKKIEARDFRYGSNAYEDGTTELFHDELVVDTLFESIQEKLDNKRVNVGKKYNITDIYLN